MDQHNNHSELIHDFYKDQKEVFDSSTQAIYGFLDDDSRVCNQKFAALLGYASPEDWSRTDVDGAFPEVFVDQKSQQALVTAYQNAMENCVGSTIKVAWKKKSGGTVSTTVILVPILYRGHMFALHFIS